MTAERKYIERTAGRRLLRRYFWMAPWSERRGGFDRRARVVGARQ